MKHHIDIQNATDAPLPVPDSSLIAWATHTLNATEQPSSEFTLRLVTADEMQTLNKTYRKQDKPTNVLAFPSEVADEESLTHHLLGDVIICPEVLASESKAYHTELDAHWAHILIHGILHLLGYDHMHEEDTKAMQSLEIKLLTTLKFKDPYNDDTLMKD